MCLAVPVRVAALLDNQWVEIEVGGVAGEVAHRERLLMAEEGVVHLPELALGGGALGCLGCELSGRVHIVER